MGFEHFLIPIFVLFLPQVFRSKLDSDPGLSFHQPKSGSASPLQHGAATLGRNMSSKVRSDPSDPHLVLHLHLLCKRPPLFSLQMIISTSHKSVRHLFLTLCLLPLTQQSPLLAASSTGSLPRNLAATLQDIETKRQLALQQKGNWCAPERHVTQTNSPSRSVH